MTWPVKSGTGFRSTGEMPAFESTRVRRVKEGPRNRTPWRVSIPVSTSG